MTVCFDSNVLIEAFGDDPALIEIARPIINTLASRSAKLPEQVLREFLAVAHRKRFMPVPAAREAVSTLSRRFDVVVSEVGDLIQASELAERHKLQFYDALLCCTTRRAGCSFLLSRDMQDGSLVGTVRIVDPFSPANTELVADLLN